MGNYCKELVDVSLSRYIPLRDAIMGYEPIHTRMEYIKRFIKNFTRSAITDGDSEEDEHWLYCIETNTKLLPSF